MFTREHSITYFAISSSVLRFGAGICSDPSDLRLCRSMNEYRVLLIEDDDVDAFAITRELSRPGIEYFVTHVERLNDAMQELDRAEFDVILTDLTLPDAFHLESVQSLREKVPALPVIVLTGVDSERLATEALQAGAQEYIQKEIAGGKYLQRTIKHAIERQKLAVHNESLLAEVQVQEVRLEEKTDRLQSLIHSVQRFVDDVAGDLRTPLEAIRRAASTIQSGTAGAVNEEQRQELDDIRSSVDELAAVVDDMLKTRELSAGVMGTPSGGAHLPSPVEPLSKKTVNKAAKELVAG